jgi:hypothetical protein
MYVLGHPSNGTSINISSKEISAQKGGNLQLPEPEFRIVNLRKVSIPFTVDIYRISIYNLIK